MSPQQNSRAGRPQWLRFFIFLYLIVLAYLYFNAPPKEADAPGAGGTAGQTTGTMTAAGVAAADDGTTAGLRTADGNSSLTVHTHPGELVSLRTNLHNISLDSVGGVVNSWRLLHTGSQSFDPETNTTGVELIRRIPGVNQLFADQQNWPLEVSFKERSVHSYEDFNHVQWNWEEIPTEGASAVRLQSPEIRGLRIEKTVEFQPDSYIGKLRVTVHNDNETTIPVVDEFNRGLTLRWGPGLVERDLSQDLDSSLPRYDTAIVHNGEEALVQRPTLGGEPITLDGPFLWAGVESKFFAAVIIPDQPDDAARRQLYYFRTLVPNSYKVNAAQAGTVERRAELERYSAPLVMELATSSFDVGAGSSKTFEFSVYAGPKKHSILKKAGHGLQEIIYSESWWWMRAIYLLLTDTLNGIHKFIVSNYGLAIMLLTVIVKLLVFPLVLRSIKMQAKTSAEMKRIKPHLEAINEKYKEDPQEKQRQTWKVYQEHGINPLGAMRSCLPVLPQIPIFIGLYRIANDTIDLQGAKFLWIQDLSQADHLAHFGTHIPLVGSYFNLLPFMVAITQVISSKIAMSRSMQNITDPNQIQMQKMMIYLIPVMVLVTMYHFPAALMLYWIASNVWQIGQSVVTNRILDREEAKHIKAGPPPKKAKKPVDPNSFMGRMMARAEEARKEMERREQAAKKGGGGQRKKR